MIRRGFVRAKGYCERKRHRRSEGRDGGLEKGGTAVDAVEEGVRYVESNPEDNTVGYGGLPNLLGEVELDAT
jgi:isoaspartyl peptidase/L-asparaginase-like protein (Ntn-hydrolase superfamily)